ncbi:acyl-CoA N-acyltransferase [Xylariaceae sp. FL0255]|nr:acyl-CoA N-acyltransferase [Xylariaceae sp. FL0255]
MSLPTNNNQSSIRSFFRPKPPPTYAAPPSSSVAVPVTPALPPTSSSTTAPRRTIQPNAIIPQPPPPSSSTPLHPSQNGHTPTPLPREDQRPPNLHPQATITRILPSHIPALRRITSFLLPVNYPDSFYARLSDPLSSGAFSRVILWHDDPSSTSSRPGIVVGGLVCRPEPSPFADYNSSQFDPRTGPPQRDGNVLYIQSLVLLSPYRNLGLAAALLDAVARDAAASEFACEEVWAHVWTQNQEGLKWYLARGFSNKKKKARGEAEEEEDDIVENYYFKLQPAGAWIVRRPILGREGGNGRSAQPLGPVLSVGKPSITAAVANLPPYFNNTSNGSPPPLVSRPPPSSTSLSASSTTQRRPSPTPTTGSGKSFQNTRPDTEWNDLPPDMAPTPPNGSSNNLLSPPVPHGGGGSGASSRSSSSAAPRKKRDRAYPAAAFGNM